ncbi:MAG: ROK family protein [Leptospiraceae bacterium]|nr:ROK family protein [Leptospiraceae bacterium]MDW7975893.1 ROK family protein [Leptospiraceae bacterium]
MEYRVGIDLGGTKTEILLLNSNQEVLLRERIPTDKSSYESILHTIQNLYKKALSHIPSGKEFTLGMGIPGIIDPETDVVINANTTILIGKPLKKDLEALLEHPIFIENDANCFALAEAMAGAGKEFSFVFGVIMGTGCGGGFVMDKKIHRGRHGIAGEWGHFSIDPSGEQCWCGNRGCIETLISGSGVENQYYKLTKEKISMKEIVERAKKSLSPAKEVFEKFLDDYGRAVGGIISTFDPDVIVLGGGLSNIEELYTIGYEKVKKYTFYHNVKTPIKKNQLGDSAGVFGAAWLGI